MAFAAHLVASTRGRQRTLLHPEQMRWLWVHLRRAFPRVYAGTLMPDHVHLLAELGHELRFRRVLSSFTRVFGVRFDPVTQLANSEAIARRAARYIWLNAVREGLVNDPFAWPASTLRDLLGAIADPWPLPEGARVGRFLASLDEQIEHRIQWPRPGNVVVASSRALVDACAAALRLPPAGVTTTPGGRRLVCSLAAEVGDFERAALGQLLGLHRDSVTRLARRGAAPHELIAAKLCLSDERLRHHGYHLLAPRIGRPHDRSTPSRPLTG